MISTLRSNLTQRIDLLMVPKQRILLISNLPPASTILPTPLTLLPPSLSSPLTSPSTLQPQAPIPNPVTLPLPSIRITYLRNQHLIPRRHARRNPLPLLIQPPRPYSKHLRLIKLFDAALRQKDTTCGFCLGFYALHEDAVEEGGEGFDGFEGGRLGLLVWVVEG